MFKSDRKIETTPDEAYEQRNDDYVVILDVRTQKEYDKGHIGDVIHIDFHSDDFEEQLNNLDKSKEYIVHCRGGGRANKTVKKMERMGFGEAHNMTGGIERWKKEGLPIEK